MLIKPIEHTATAVIVDVVLLLISHPPSVVIRNSADIDNSENSAPNGQVMCEQLCSEEKSAVVTTFYG
jgi:hypothetical protein